MYDTFMNLEPSRCACAARAVAGCVYVWLGLCMCM
jgi:hypothetical protein